MSLSSPEPALALRWGSIKEVRSLPPLPSGYVTDSILRLSRSTAHGIDHWELTVVALPSPLVKEYDSGAVDDWLASYLDEGAEAHLRFLLAERGGEVVGLLAVRDLAWNRTLWLLDIRVRASMRRGGVGSALLRAVQEHAQAQRARGILVETQTTNLPAIRFYQKHGFVIAGFNDHLYDNDDLETGEVALYLFWEAVAGS